MQAVCGGRQAPLYTTNAPGPLPNTSGTPKKAAPEVNGQAGAARGMGPDASPREEYAPDLWRTVVGAEERRLRRTAHIFSKDVRKAGTP